MREREGKKVEEETVLKREKEKEVERQTDYQTVRNPDRQIDI